MTEVNVSAFLPRLYKSNNVESGTSAVSSWSLRQVWAVGEDRGLYFRMGVTPSEPSGNGWIPISAQWGSRKEPDGPRWV